MLDTILLFLILITVVINSMNITVVRQNMKFFYDETMEKFKSKGL